MLEIYQAYARDALRSELDKKRKKGLDFVPSETCGQCHEKNLANWKKTKHARAYKTLQRVKRQGDPNCISCHTLGFGMEKGFYTPETTHKLGGVNCQNCHRFNVAEHQKKGFIRPKVTAETCETCHTPVTDPKFLDLQEKRFKTLRLNPQTK